MFLIKMITIAYGLHHLMTSKRVPETVRVKLEKKLAELVNICSDDQVRELAYILKRNKEDNNKKEIER